jgi:hypothetical protein
MGHLPRLPVPDTVAANIVDWPTGYRTTPAPARKDECRKYRRGQAKHRHPHHPILRPLFIRLRNGFDFLRRHRDRGGAADGDGLGVCARIARGDIVGARRARVPLILCRRVRLGGRWAVNGARAGAVQSTSHHRRGHVCGVSVRLRTLWLSLSNADGFLAAADRPHIGRRRMAQEDHHDRADHRPPRRDPSACGRSAP